MGHTNESPPSPEGIEIIMTTQTQTDIERAATLARDLGTHLLAMLSPQLQRVVGDGWAQYGQAMAELQRLWESLNANLDEMRNARRVLGIGEGQDLVEAIESLKAGEVERSIDSSERHGLLTRVWEALGISDGEDPVAAVESLKADLESFREASGEALTEIQQACGYWETEWEYPGQVTRDVMKLRGERDAALDALAKIREAVSLYVDDDDTSHEDLVRAVQATAGSRANYSEMMAAKRERDALQADRDSWRRTAERLEKALHDIRKILGMSQLEPCERVAEELRDQLGRAAQ